MTDDELRERALARMVPREEWTPEHEAAVAEMMEANRDKIAAIRKAFAPVGRRIYQLDPVWGDDAYEVFPVPPDVQAGDIMIIAVNGITFHRVATVDEPRDLVNVWRDGAAGHLVTPDGWERTPTVDGERPLTEQGWT